MMCKRGFPERYPAFWLLWPNAWIRRWFRYHYGASGARSTAFSDRCPGLQRLNAYDYFPLKFHLGIKGGTFFIGVTSDTLVWPLTFKIGAVDYPNARRINKSLCLAVAGRAWLAALSYLYLLWCRRLSSRFFLDRPILIMFGRVVLGGLIIAFYRADWWYQRAVAPLKMVNCSTAGPIWWLTDFRLDDLLPFWRTLPAFLSLGCPIFDSVVWLLSI